MNSTLAHVSASGEDTVLNLVYGASGTLLDRISGELAQRGLNVLSAKVDRGFVGLGSYAFVYSADLGSDDPSRQWNVELIRAQVRASIQAATTYTPSVSLSNLNIPIVSDTTYVPTIGGSLPGGNASDPDQQLDSIGIPIIGDAITAVRDVVRGVGTTGQILLIAVGVLVVGGVIFVLANPERAARIARG